MEQCIKNNYQCLSLRRNFIVAQFGSKGIAVNVVVCQQQENKKNLFDYFCSENFNLKPVQCKEN